MAAPSPEWASLTGLCSRAHRCPGSSPRLIVFSELGEADRRWGCFDCWARIAYGFCESLTRSGFTNCLHVLMVDSEPGSLSDLVLTGAGISVAPGLEALPPVQDQRSLCCRTSLGDGRKPDQQGDGVLEGKARGRAGRTGLAHRALGWVPTGPSSRPELCCPQGVVPG